MTRGLRLKFSYWLKKSENIAWVYIYIGGSVDSAPDLIDVIACHLAEFTDALGAHAVLETNKACGARVRAATAQACWLIGNPSFRREGMGNLLSQSVKTADSFYHSQ